MRVVSLCGIQFVSAPNVDKHQDQISAANKVMIQNINITFFPTCGR